MVKKNIILSSFFNMKTSKNIIESTSNKYKKDGLSIISKNVNIDSVIALLKVLLFKYCIIKQKYITYKLIDRDSVRITLLYVNIAGKQPYTKVAK